MWVSSAGGGDLGDDHIFKVNGQPCGVWKYTWDSDDKKGTFHIAWHFSGDFTQLLKHIMFQVPGSPIYELQAKNGKGLYTDDLPWAFVKPHTRGTLRPHNHPYYETVLLILAETDGKRRDARRRHATRIELWRGIEFIDVSGGH